jgi:hypothetical protein
MRWYTDMRVVLDALGGRQRDFDWLITDLELNFWPPELPFSGERGPPRWLSGTALTEVVQKHDVQFIWGVFSAFKSGTKLDLEHLDPSPCADGNGDLWQPGVKIQHPLAEMEIVCFDSGCTLFLTRDAALTRQIRAYFPEATDLDVHNSRHF